VHIVESKRGRSIAGSGRRATSVLADPLVRSSEDVLDKWGAFGNVGAEVAGGGADGSMAEHCLDLRRVGARLA
jgi:hypothetical protein